MQRLNTTITSTRLCKICLLVLVVITCGCASYNVPKGSKLQFLTKITSSNLKHFEIKLLRSDGRIGSGAEGLIPPPNRERTAARSNRQLSQTDKIELILAAQLENKIADTQYCTEGYWILDTYSYGEEPYIRGECNDTATDQDRRKFPNTVKHW